MLYQCKKRKKENTDPESCYFINVPKDMDFTLSMYL